MPNPTELAQAQTQVLAVLVKNVFTGTLATLALDLYGSDTPQSRQLLATLNTLVRADDDDGGPMGFTRWEAYCDEIHEQCDDEGVMLYVTGQEDEDA